MRVEELIQTLQTERVLLEDLLSGLSAEQMAIPGVEGDWTVKDLVVHLTVWEQRGTQWIQWSCEMAQGQRSEVPHAGYSGRDLDKLNQVIFEQNRDRTVTEVMADFQQAFPRLLAQIRELRDSDLELVIQADWTDHQPATIAEIVSWRYWHYRGHRQALESWVEGLK